MPNISGLESGVHKGHAVEQNSQHNMESQSSSEKLFQDLFPMPRMFQLNDRDAAESATNKVMNLVDKHDKAPVSVTENSAGVEFSANIGIDSTQANKLLNEAQKLGYPLKVMFGPNMDRDKDIEAYENANATPGMSKAQALELLKSFLSHADRNRHSEDIIKSWNYVRCHPGNDPVACPEGPVSSVFQGGYFEISGSKGEVDKQGYLRLNSALKVLQEGGRKVTLRFE